jgi:hypothetical protein
MATKKSTARENLSPQDLIKKIKSDVEIKSTYSNHAQITVSANEMVIDFYTLEESIRHDGERMASHTQRVILPLSIGKGLASALANVVAAYEDATGTTLPNLRRKEEYDKITIWPETPELEEDTETEEE